MQRLHKFLGLSSAHRRLLVTSALLVGTIRLGLWLLPFQVLRLRLAGMARTANKVQQGDQATIDRVVWAVKVASRYVPKATCLTQALAAQVLLSRRGYPVRLRLGVAKGEAGQLRAHAWVESQGRIMIGGLEALSHFTPLPPLERERA